MNEGDTKNIDLFQAFVRRRGPYIASAISCWHERTNSKKEYFLYECCARGAGAADPTKPWHIFSQTPLESHQNLHRGGKKKESRNTASRGSPFLTAFPTFPFYFYYHNRLLPLLLSFCRRRWGRRRKALYPISPLDIFIRIFSWLLLLNFFLLPFWGGNISGGAMDLPFLVGLVKVAPFHLPLSFSLPLSFPRFFPTPVGKSGM